MFSALRSIGYTYETDLKTMDPEVAHFNKGL